MCVSWGSDGSAPCPCSVHTSYSHSQHWRSYKWRISCKPLDEENAYFRLLVYGKGIHGRGDYHSTQFQKLTRRRKDTKIHKESQETHFALCISAPSSSRYLEADSKRLFEKVRLHPASPLPHCGSGEEKRILGGVGGALRRPPPHMSASPAQLGHQQSFQTVSRAGNCVRYRARPCAGNWSHRSAVFRGVFSNRGSARYR